MPRREHRTDGRRGIHLRAEVYDSEELLGWIRTFTGRILSLDFSNRTVENKFKQDMREMYRMYGLEE